MTKDCQAKSAEQTFADTTLVYVYGILESSVDDDRKKIKSAEN